MIPDVSRWQPLQVEAIQEHLGAFGSWCLCGGRSLDWLVGRSTRDHGDTDIGVFRSELEVCLPEIGAPRVFLCDPPGDFTPWDGGPVPLQVHDIWISDIARTCWVLQVMVYDDDGDEVVYRRDPRIRWPKNAHAITVRGVRVVNPVITLLFKVNKPQLQAKACLDVELLIGELARRAARQNP